MQTSPDQEIERYLCSGEQDHMFSSWPGSDLFARAKHGRAALRGALISTVRSRTRHAVAPAALCTMDAVAFTRAKVTPMVRGLFPQCEREAVLEVLGRSVVFLTPSTIDAVLENTPWPRTAWVLANLYLASCGAKLLAKDAPEIVGLSEETTCYVSMDYFHEQSRIDDFVVHEAAHTFHNCKRQTAGLREIRGREWLLPIDFAKRETFAYACEAYSHILELADGPPVRRRLVSEMEQGPMPADERVVASDYMDILREAVAARNGWKVILARCAAGRAQRDDLS